MRHEKCLRCIMLDNTTVSNIYYIHAARMTRRDLYEKRLLLSRDSHGAPMSFSAYVTPVTPSLVAL